MTVNTEVILSLSNIVLKKVLVSQTILAEMKFINVFKEAIIIPSFGSSSNSLKVEGSKEGSPKILPLPKALFVKLRDQEDPDPVTAPVQIIAYQLESRPQALTGTVSPQMILAGSKTPSSVAQYAFHSETLYLQEE
ncbi:MAG: hypothetical protein ACXWVW_06960 [Sulfuricurvum sp.]